MITLKESMIRVIGPRDKRDKNAINCCSHSDNWTRGLSPFVLGPVRLWDGRISQTMENAWQYSKVYKQHIRPNGRPSSLWYEWSDEGFNNERAVRYPMGKGKKPEGLWFKDQLIGYVEARRLVYWPLYRDAVAESPAFEQLKKELYNCLDSDGMHITLWDFDGYDRGEKNLWRVACDPNKKMGHAFVLAAMLVYGADIEVNDLGAVEPIRYGGKIK